MNRHDDLLALIAETESALRQAKTVEECRRIYERAKTLRRDARDDKAPLSVLQQAACLSIEAEHALGQALCKIKLARGAPGNQHSVKKSGPVTTASGPNYLRGLKISKHVSSRSQLLAKLSR